MYILINYENIRTLEVIEYNNNNLSMILRHKENNIKYYTVKNILDDTTITNSIKINILNTLLDKNSLNKYYIIYFIFTKQYEYDYYIDDDDDDDDITTNELTQNTIKLNSYVEYKKIKRVFGGSKYCNLDETVKNDFVFDLYITSQHTNNILQKKTYNTCKAHINFISWVYYSGIYTYLINNENIKTTILNEMNEKKLLYGNTFIQYIIYGLECPSHSTQIFTEDITIIDKHCQPVTPDIEVQTVTDHDDVVPDDVVPDDVVPDDVVPDDVVPDDVVPDDVVDTVDDETKERVRTKLRTSLRALLIASSDDILYNNSVTDTGTDTDTDTDTSVDYLSERNLSKCDMTSGDYKVSDNGKYDDTTYVNDNSEHNDKELKKCNNYYAIENIDKNSFINELSLYVQNIICTTFGNIKDLYYKN